MVEVSDDVEDAFDCMRRPAGPTETPASAAAQAQKAMTSPGALYVRRSMVGDGGDASFHVDRVPDRAARLARATDLGELLIDAGLFEDAVAVLNPTVRLQAVVMGPSHPDTLRTLAALARAVRAHGRPDLAVQVWSGWHDAGGEFLARRLWSVSEAARRRFFRDDRRNVDQYLGALRAAPPADAAMQALAISLRHKGLLAEVAGQIDGRTRESADPAVTSAAAQLRQRRAQFAALALRDRAGAPEARLLRREIDDGETQIAVKLGLDARPAAAAGAQELLGRLRPGEALVDFLVFRDAGAPGEPPKERMAAVVARAGRPAELIWWTDVAPVRTAATRLRTAILMDEAAPGRAEALQASAHGLHDVLWKPIERAVGDAERVLVAPDDIVSVTPLAALRDAQGRTLAERHELATLSAPRDLLAAASPPRGKTALVVGDPAFGGPATPAAAGRVIGARSGEIVFAPLPGTQAESAAVNALLARSFASRLLSGGAATKAAVASTRAPAVLHLATHGFFLIGLAGSPEEGDPLVALSRSGLAFAGANAGLRSPASSGSVEGILTGLEALSLDLRGTRLVVLSACETGLGQTASGEGVYGLAQALHRAGAQAVLATLWPVSDEATSAFMQAFYARIATGEAPQPALRATQLAFAREGAWRDPVYWAPFVLTGR